MWHKQNELEVVVCVVVKQIPAMESIVPWIKKLFVLYSAIYSVILYDITISVHRHVLLLQQVQIP